MPWINNDKPTKLERIIAALCYLTLGLVGLLFIILSGQRNQSRFFRFHFIQSILLGIIAIILNWISGTLMMLLSGIMQLFVPILGGLAPAVSYWVGWGLQIILSAFNLFLLYGLIWSLLGKYAEIPLISNVVRRQMP